MRRRPAIVTTGGYSPFRAAGVVAAAVSLLAATSAGAQLPIPASSQFDVSGFMEEATLGVPVPNPLGIGVGPGAGAHQGGVIKVNGHTIIVPSETIVIFPANALTWQEMFALSPAPYTGTATGMAMADLPTPLTTYEAHVIGNRVLGGTGGPDVYIAGLIYVSQHALNSGQGFINFIDYANAELRVGGILNDPTTGARVRINDPVIAAIGTGRYSKGVNPGPDPRFQVDQDNPTITAGTGFPMCLPRADPATADDALCPRAQRPAAPVGFATIINTNNPAALPGVPPDATKQIPMKVGDWISFAGTLVTDAVQATVYPAGGLAALTCAAGTGPAACTYVSAHTITSNVAVFTFPGANPAYIRTDVTLIGTGGLNVLGVGEATIRTRFEGFSTDPSRQVHLYGIDLNPLTGATTDRDFGTIFPDPGPPIGANKGRWRFRPPCLPFGTVPTKPDRDCVMNAAGTFLPPPREMRAVIQGAFTAPITPASPTAANGIVWGQYHAPISDYLFPENIPGNPIVENNFNALDFLAFGGYTSAPGTLVGQLNPWPSNIVPAGGCVAPTAANSSAGGPYTVAFNGTVTLAASSSATAPVTFTWVAPAAGTISPLTGPNPSYSALGAAAGQIVPVSVTAQNNCGSAALGSTVTVSAVNAPTVTSVSAVNPSPLFSGQAGSISVTGSDPNLPALVPLTFLVTQTAGPALVGLTVTAGPNPPGTGATITFTAPTLPIGQVTPSVITLSITARNTGGAVSTPVTTTFNVQPLPDALAITTALYRTGNQRLSITATSSVISPNVTLTLLPYATQAGGTFTPTGAFTNTGGGIYTITLVGVPEPFCGHVGNTPPACTLPGANALQVRSNLNGTSPPHALDTVRQ